MDVEAAQQIAGQEMLDDVRFDVEAWLADGAMLIAKADLAEIKL